MKYIKAKFLKNNEMVGNSYTFRTDDDVKPNDILVTQTGKHIKVVDEKVAMGWVEEYGAEKIAVAKKVVETISNGKE